MFFQTEAHARWADRLPVRHPLAIRTGRRLRANDPRARTTGQFFSNGRHLTKPLLKAEGKPKDLKGAGMQSEDQLAGWIDKNKFYLDFAEKMIIDHAGGEPVQKLGRQFQCISMKWINPWTHRLHVLIENQMFHC